MSNKKAALYIRVSTVMQADRDSLPLQRDDLVNYARYALNIDDYEIFEDAGFSAKNTDRPKYQEMMARVRNREFSHILVWKIDRISRNLIDFCEMYEEIKKYDTAFISKSEQFDTSTAMGEAMLKIILVFAELERKLTGERVLSVMIDRASKGMWNGARPPLGFDMSADLDYPIVNKKEAELVQYIFDLYEETRSSSKVACHLYENDYQTKRGGVWGSKAVVDILRNPFYIGTYRYNYRESARGKKKNENEWVEVEDNHPAIIRKDQFHRVQNILDANYKGDSQKHRKNWKVHVFQRMLYCENCGRVYIAGTGSLRRDGITPSRYYCTGMASGEKCSGTIGDVTLVPFIFNYLANFCELTERITPQMRKGTIERILLHGLPFLNVESVERGTLDIIQDYLCCDPDVIAYKAPAGSIRKLPQPPQTPIADEIKKYETALSRLEELYLFSEETMSQKDFLMKKKEFQGKIASLKDEAQKETRQPPPQPAMDYQVFINSIIILKETMSGKQDAFTLEWLVKNIGIEMLHQIVNDLIDKITVKDNLVQSIVFKNGITHFFNYKPETKNKAIRNVDVFLSEHQETIITHVKTYGFIDRKTLRVISGCDSTTAETAIRSMVRREKLVLMRKGRKKQYILPEKSAK